MCGVSPRFSWMTSTAPCGVSASATTPINSPLGPLKRISSPDGGADAGSDAGSEDGGTSLLAVGGDVAAVAALVDCGVVELALDVVGADALLDGSAVSSSPQAASSAIAAAPVTPISPRRRNASRRDSRPSSQSSATS